MAKLALMRKLSGRMTGIGRASVVGLVTRVALSRSASILAVRVALTATDCGMRTGQGESVRRMIERRIPVGS
jgi:hypothetical protein